MPTSTSWHRTSTDGCRSPLALATYTLGNIRNNYFSKRTGDPSLRLSSWTTNNSAPAILSRALSKSPTRSLCDLFWANLPWRSISHESDGINLVDLGCGSGNYYHSFQQYSHGLINRYIGIDGFADPKWSEMSQQNHQTNFLHANLNTMNSPIPNTATMAVSQSALEHINDDLSLFHRIAHQLQKNPRPFLQIHMVPSVSCLGLYGFHGVRQYHPGSLSRIWRLFEPFSTGELFCLGNPAITQLHFQSITLPSWLRRPDWRHSHPQQYRERLSRLLTNTTGDIKRPSFYALVIYSHRKPNLRPFKINPR